MSKKFQRKIENFICKHCGFKVQGNGYTNHCPNCLWSQHVDNFPGDRQAKCKGMMRPISLEKNKSGYRLTHRCKKCALIVNCKTNSNDNIEAMIQLSKSLAKKALF